VRVLRKKAGDQILVLDGKGGLYTCILKDSKPREVRFEVEKEEQWDGPEHHIHLIIAPTKKIDRMEWLIEKSVEIGIQEISFVRCMNSERPQLKIDRLQKKAISAMKQSMNLFLPRIHDIIPFQEVLTHSADNVNKYICHVRSGENNFLLNVVKKGRSYQILIGPEGDFTDKELIQAEEHGYTPVSLGENRLRTETAGLVACVLLNALQVKN